MSEVIHDEKKRLKTVVLAAIIVVALSSVLIYYIAKSQKKYIPPPPTPKIDVVGKQDAAKDSFIKQSTAQMQEIDKQVKELAQQNNQFKEALTALQAPGVLNRPLPLPTNKPTTSTGMPPIPPPPPSSATTASGVPYPGGTASQGTAQPILRDKPLTGLIAVEHGTAAATSQTKSESEQSSKTSAQGDKLAKKEQAVVSAGSFVKAVLLNGVDAPTGSKGKGSPYPVLLRIIDLAQLPNRFRSDIKECFAIGEAMGELSSERVMTRVNTLSCVSKDGNIIETAVTGYVVGEDGKIGQSATIVTRQGAILARSLISGFLSGVSQAFAASATTVNVSPYGSVSTINPSEVAKAGAGQGVSNAAAGLAKFYDDFSREMFPVAEVNAGRECEIVFINRFTLTEVK